MARLTTHWAMPQWHRSLEDWSALIATAGFAMARLYEPRPTAERAQRNGNMVLATRIPFFLVFELLSLR